MKTTTNTLRYALSRQQALFFDPRSPSIAKSYRMRIINDVCARANAQGYDRVQIFTPEEDLVAEGAIGNVQEV